jgi:phenylalanine-4-hydroxylase
MPKAYGAGLLSSFGELGRFATEAELVPLDLDRAAATSYDPTTYQRKLFVAPSFAAMSASIMGWLETI